MVPSSAARPALKNSACSHRSSALDLLLVHAQQPARGGAQEALESRLVPERALDLGAFGSELVGVRDDIFELRDEPGPDGGVAFGLGWVEAQHEPVAGADADLIEPYVVLDCGVAALPGQGWLS